MTETIRTKDPIVALTDWSVYEVPLFGSENLWTRHFVGYAEDLDLPQVSSAIGTFDPSTGIGTAASGRVFQLVGQSWRHWESSRMWVDFLVFWNVQGVRAQGVQHHHCEGEAVPTAVDAVNQHSVAHDNAIGLQPARQFFVRHLFGVAQFFDERFSPSFVKLTGLQFGQSYIVFNVRILKAFRTPVTQYIEFNACIKNRQTPDYTADHYRSALDI